MKNMKSSLIGPFVDDKNLCLVVSATTHVILKDFKYFSYLKKQTTNVNSICDSAKLIEGFERTDIILPRGNKICN